MSKCSVFISSACYDLADLRRELRADLEANGFITSLSEDANSAFYVDPLDNSISSCLIGVEASDAVVCIVDRRYGGVLRDGPLAGLSATHAEVRRARDVKKPVFAFIRKLAWDEYVQLKDNSTYNTKWVEPNNEDNRRKWVDFVRELTELRLARAFLIGETSLTSALTFLLRLLSGSPTSFLPIREPWHSFLSV